MNFIKTIQNVQNFEVNNYVNLNNNNVNKSDKGEENMKCDLNIETIVNIEKLVINNNLEQPIKKTEIIVDVPIYGKEKIINNVKARLLVDKDDYYKYDLMNKTIYYNHNCGYAQIWWDNKIQYLHRLIMNDMKPELINDPNLTVDHIDRNKLNNTRVNLRLANRSQQCGNRKENSNKKYQVGKGVSYNAKTGKWVCSCSRKDIGKKYNKSFNTIEEAKEAYEKVSKEYFGEFAHYGNGF